MKDIGMVSFKVLKDYLLKKGWTEEPIPRGQEVMKFKAPTQVLVDKEGGGKEPMDWTVFIPASRRLADYERGIEIALEAIAVYERRATKENRQPEDVMRDVIEMQEGIGKRTWNYEIGEPVIQLYSPYSYHSEAAIVLNELGRKALIEALQRNEPDVVIQAYVNDGEGFDLRIAVLPEPEIRKLQDPYQHDWKDTTLKDPRTGI